MLNLISRRLSECVQGFLADHSRSRWVYDHIYYSRWISGDLSFFNSGIAPVDDELLDLGFAAFELHQAQVYHEAIKAYRRVFANQENIRVLEVACGLGGGIQYLTRSLPAAEIFGIDLSFNSVRRSRKLCAAQYAVANAHYLPFKAAAFDLIIAVECLHRLDAELFFAEASRLLRQDGVVCAVDFRATPFASISQRIAAACAAQGLKVKEMTELTGRVLLAADVDTVRQRRVLAAIPWGFRSLGRELLVMPGSKRHASYANGQRCYYLAAAQKTSTGAGVLKVKSRA